MKTEIGTPCIQSDFIVLLLPSSSKTGGSELHVPLRALNFTPSFAKFPILKSADAKNSGRNKSVNPQKMSCMLSSVTGRPFFHVSSEQPAAIELIDVNNVCQLSCATLTYIFLQAQNNQISLKARYQNAIPDGPQSIEMNMRFVLITVMC